MDAAGPRRPTAVVLASAAALLIVAYVGIAALLLRFDIDRLVFPAMSAPVASDGLVAAFEEPGQHGAALRMRRTEGGAPGDARGCVAWFPGRHGEVDDDTRALFDALRHAGVAVFAASYPGQDGAPGRATLADVEAMSARAVGRVVAQCGATRTVVAGRSLGAMVAAHAAGSNRPAGLVLVSAAPSLSAGVRAALRERSVTWPLAWLPVDRLLATDDALTDPLTMELHVVLFQGAADTRTPLVDLWPDPSQPAHPPIVVVPDGTHADTLKRARPAIVATILDMIRGAQAQAAAGYDDD